MNFDENEYDETKEQFKVTFVSLIFVNETIITAGSDGFLYVWHDMKIVKTQNAHPILCLNTTKDSNMFASGNNLKYLEIYRFINDLFLI